MYYLFENSLKGQNGWKATEFTVFYNLGVCERVNDVCEVGELVCGGLQRAPVTKCGQICPTSPDSTVSLVDAELFNLPWGGGGGLKYADF